MAFAEGIPWLCGAAPLARREFVSHVVFVDVGDVIDSFLADAGSSNEFHVVHPDVGVEPFLGGLRSQYIHAGRTTIVGGEGEEDLVEVIDVCLVTIKSFHRGTKIFTPA